MSVNNVTHRLREMAVYALNAYPRDDENSSEVKLNWECLYIDNIG